MLEQTGFLSGKTASSVQPCSDHFGSLASDHLLLVCRDDPDGYAARLGRNLFRVARIRSFIKNHAKAGAFLTYTSADLMFVLADITRKN
jgi:hypothetical protein